MKRLALGGVEWVDDISGYGWVAHGLLARVRAYRPPEDGFAVANAWHSVSAEPPIVDLTLLASISSRLAFVCVAVSETLKQLPYEQQGAVRKRTQRAGDVPYAAASRANRS